MSRSFRSILTRSYMRIARHLGRLTALAVVPACVGAQAPREAAQPAPPLPLKHAPKPTSTAISEQDLMTRLYIFADDSMQGRATGTEGYRKGTDYIAAELKRLGLQPAGDGGTYFQALPMGSRGIGAASRLSVNGSALVLWQDFAPLAGAGMPRALEGQVVYGGPITSYAGAAGLEPPLTREQIAGKVVLVTLPEGGSMQNFSFRSPRNPLSGAAAVLITGLERAPATTMAALRRPAFGSTAAGQDAAFTVYVTSSAAQRILGADPAALQPGATGNPVSGAIAIEEAPSSARNVVAVLPGSDPVLRHQYVAIGAHADHVGMNSRPVDHDSLKAFNAAVWRARGSNNDAPNLGVEQRARIRVNVDSLRALRPARLDSISNGADDDGSGSMAVLEIAEALATGAEKPKRSVLFVWHAAEEMGLLGAKHYVENPTVPLDSIVAQINIDMIGRGSASDLINGGPNYVGMIGARRLSTQFGDLAEQVSREKGHDIQFDFGMDADGHPQRIYCRSDHYHYARFGIPIAFFFTGLHGDYHQVTDEPQYIDYPHYTRLTRYLHDLTLAVANRGERLVVDQPRMDPNGSCVQ